jgi:TPR repeat protein
MDKAEQSEYSIEDLLGKVDGMPGTRFFFFYVQCYLLIFTILDTTVNLSAVARNNILQGDASSMFKVGKQYFNSGDYENAAEWYKKASIAMHPKAQIELGQLYYYGKGVPISFVDAYHWYTMQMNDPLAQYYLGVMHEQGDSAMYVNKARAWFECSAENGCIEAQYKAGEMNAHQSYNPKYRLKAIKYLTMAANNGHKKAITALKGMTLLLGDSQGKYICVRVQQDIHFLYS